MQCGTALPPGSKFCPNCGSPIGSAPTSTPTSPAAVAPISTPPATPTVAQAPPQGREYSTNVLLVFLFLAGLASIFINGWLVVLVVLFSSIAVYSDACNLNTGRAAGKESMSSSTHSPLSWGLLTLLFWIIAMPLYLYQRRQIFYANQ